MQLTSFNETLIAPVDYYQVDADLVDVSELKVGVAKNFHMHINYNFLDQCLWYTALG